MQPINRITHITSGGTLATHVPVLGLTINHCGAHCGTYTHVNNDTSLMCSVARLYNSAHNAPSTSTKPKGMCVFIALALNEIKVAELFARRLYIYRAQNVLNKKRHRIRLKKTDDSHVAKKSILTTVN